MCTKYTCACVCKEAWWDLGLTAFFFNIFFLPKKKSKRCGRKSLIISNQKYKIWAHRPSIKGTKPLFIVIKTIIIITILVNTSQETRYNLNDPVSFFVSRLWGRRPDRLIINEVVQIVYILEFKQTTDGDEEFLEVKETEANEKHKSIISALRETGQEWIFDRLTLWWATVDWL